ESRSTATTSRPRRRAAASNPSCWRPAPRTSSRRFASIRGIVATTRDVAQQHTPAKPLSVESEDCGEGFRFETVDVEPDLRDLAVTKAIDGDLVSFRPHSVSLGRPADKHSRVLDRVQKRFRLELERALGHRDQLLEQSDDFLSSPIVAGVVLLAGLVPADLVGKEHASCVPVAPRAGVVELADRSFFAG